MKKEVFNMRIDWRTIKKKTGCNEDQAKYLAKEIRNLPKIQKTFMSNLDKINLRNCIRVEVNLMYGYMDDDVNICGYRKDEKLSFTMFGEEHVYERLYRYSVSSILDKVFYSVI